MNQKQLRNQKEQVAPKQVQYEDVIGSNWQIKRTQVRSERYKNLITHAF